MNEKLSETRNGIKSQQKILVCKKIIIIQTNNTIM